MTCSGALNDLSQRECVGMISACADELRQAYDYWQECICGQVESCAGWCIMLTTSPPLGQSFIQALSACHLLYHCGHNTLTSSSFFSPPFRVSVVNKFPVSLVPLSHCVHVSAPLIPLVALVTSIRTSLVQDHNDHNYISNAI